MPDLSSILGRITNIGIPEIRNILCHQATLYWLIRTKLGRDPILNEISEAGPIVRNLATKTGRKISKQDYQSGPIFRAGTILFFDGTNDHSCIINRQNEICGYNQVGWFPGGLSCQYSEHAKTDMVWPDPQRVRASNGQPCYLYAVNEVSALGNLQVYLPK